MTETPPENQTFPPNGEPTPPQQPTQIRIQLPDTQPVVTYTIIGLTILVFLAQYATNAIFGFDIPQAIGVKFNPLIDSGQYWRLLTPMLLHGSLMHIGFNMYAVYILGGWLERFYGHWQFLLLYILAGFTGGLASYLLTSSPSLGASTSTFGLLAAYGILAYRNQKVFGSRARLMWRNALQVAVLNLILGLSPGIDNWGHLGGVIGGAALAWLAGPILKLAGTNVDDLRMINTGSSRQFTLVFGVLFLLTFFLAVILPGAS